MSKFLAPLVIFSGTVGAGIFALPAFLSRSGWIPFVSGLIAVGILMHVLHAEYLRITLLYPEQSIGALARRFWGKSFGVIAAVSVYGGLLLSLLVYVILGGRFAEILFPSFSASYSPILFWVVASFPLFLNMRHKMELRFAIAGITLALIAFVVADAWPLQFANANAVGANPWSVYAGILFAFGGWASAEQVGKYLGLRSGDEEEGVRAIFRGTILVGLLYFLFATAIVSSDSLVTEDALSGLTDIPALMRKIFALLGLSALWNSFGAVIREFIESMEDDTHISHRYATALAGVAPVALFMLGLNGLTQAVEIGGGFFGSIQYIAIAMIALKALPQTRAKRLGLWVATALFLLAAIGTSVAWW
jgi:amino acid permease